MRSGEEVQHRHLFRIEAGGVGGEIRVFLEDEAEASGDIALFQFAAPEPRGADALHGELVVAQAADHVEVHIGRDLGERHGRLLAKGGRADEPDFFTRPESEDDPAAGFLRIISALPGERRGEFHNHGGPGSVIVRTRVNFAFLTRTVHRTAGETVTEMIVVRADDDIFPPLSPFGGSIPPHCGRPSSSARCTTLIWTWVLGKGIRRPRAGFPCRDQSGDLSDSCRSKRAKHPRPSC